MPTAQHLVSALILLSAHPGVDGSNGYYSSSVDQCRFSSQDLSDLEYISSYWFNKVEYIRFNSTVGKFVGYTEFGVYNAERWNHDPAYLAQERAQKDRYCKPNAQIYINSILTKTVQPAAGLRLEKASTGGHPAVLMCSAYDFYPKMIKLTWYRDGQEVTGDVIHHEELADGDWYYQVHSHLEFTPKAGEKISCVVEHASLKEPLELIWDPSMPETDRIKLVLGAAELVLGLVAAAAGYTYHKTKSRERISVPKNCMEKSLDVYWPIHQKSMKKHFILQLLNAYRSVKTSSKKSVMNTGDSHP